MAANKLKAKIEQLELKLGILSQEKQSLENQITEINRKSKSELEQNNLDWQNKSEILKIENELHITSLNEITKALTDRNEVQQQQLDKRELKKLAEAYGEQETINKKDENVWFKRILVIGVVLLCSAVGSIIITHNLSWVESVKYYIVDIVLFSSVWFCISQYSNTVKLKNDYANRKVLAQSFHNILNNLADNLEIKNKFIEKTTDVLCAPHAIGEKEPLLSKKILKDVAEIVGAVKNV